MPNFKKLGDEIVFDALTADTNAPQLTFAGCRVLQMTTCIRPDRRSEFVSSLAMCLDFAGSFYPVADKDATIGRVAPQLYGLNSPPCTEAEWKVIGKCHDGGMATSYAPF